MPLWRHPAGEWTGSTSRCSIRSDDVFLAPLKDLNPQGARGYLGAIHNMARFKERIATARKYLPDFGLGAYCGFGRLPVSELPNILADHLKAIEIAAPH